MAKRRRRHERDAREDPISSLTPSPLTLRVKSLMERARNAVLSLEDRREFHPLGSRRPARASVRSSSRLTPPRARPGRKLDLNALRFADPKRVAVCVRRHRRREVLFALGKGGAGKRRGRWSEYSDINCR